MRGLHYIYILVLVKCMPQTVDISVHVLCGSAADTDYLATPTRESMADITITEIALENTLLLDAINKGKARFVSDCASYLQASTIQIQQLCICWAAAVSNVDFSGLMPSAAGAKVPAWHQLLSCACMSQPVHVKAHYSTCLTKIMPCACASPCRVA